MADRRRLLHEPLPLSPVIDYETFQRHIVGGEEELWAKYRAFPTYDPALQDDVLDVRPAHPVCSLVTTCIDPDPDADLYTGAGDNCPANANPDQADNEADGLGDVCDSDDDNDALLDIHETGTGVYVSPTDTGTDPLLADTDGDFIDDGTEVAMGTDPNDPSDPQPVPGLSVWGLAILGLALTLASRGIRRFSPRSEPGYSR